MQISISSLVLLTILTFTVNSYAWLGTSDGGGGVGVRCPSNVSPIGFELLDLHEIKLAGKIISLKPNSESEAINLAAEMLGQHYYSPSQISPAPYIGYLRRNIIQKIFKGQPVQNPIDGTITQVEFVDTLPLSDDIGEYNIKPGCVLEQVAYYFDDLSTLKIVRSKWQELSWLDKSALVSHEVHYFLDRNNSIEDFGSERPKTSERARKFVGQLYSLDGVVPKYSGSPKTGYYRCTSNVDSDKRDTSFRVHATGSSKFTALFASAHGYSSAYQTKALFNGVSLDDLLAMPDGEYVIETSLEILTEENIPSFSVRISKTWGNKPRFQAFMNEAGVKTPLGNEEEIHCWDPEIK